MRRLLGWVLILLGSAALLICGGLGLWMAPMVSVGMNQNLRVILIAATLAGPLLIFFGWRLVYRPGI